MSRVKILFHIKHLDHIFVCVSKTSNTNMLKEQDDTARVAEMVEELYKVSAGLEYETYHSAREFLIKVGYNCVYTLASIAP